MKQLRAFTLIELLVAMAVSGMVIAAGYVSYGMISRNYIDFRNHSSEINHAVTLKGVLSHDMQLAKIVKKYSSDKISTEQNDKTIVTYEWSEKYVLRKNAIEQDTFFVAVKNADMLFRGKPQNGSDGIIDELIFTTLVEGQEFIFYFDKQYGSDILMHYENLYDGGH